MKILFCSYNTCCQNPSGGVQNRIMKIRELLVQKGIIVDLYEPFKTKVVDYDILHVFYLTAECFDLVRFAKNKGVKIIISPIVNIQEGKILDFCRLFLNRLPILTAHKMCFSIAEYADLLITETFRESDFIERHYKIGSEKLFVIPNGVTRDNCQSEDIFKAIGGKKKYILQVGRFDENKNQLNIIKALSETEIDMVFIGGASPTSEKYYQECIKVANNQSNIHFLGWQNPDSNLLRSAYSNAEVVILPSYNETFGLVLLEGAIQGAKLGVSNTLPILDYAPFKDVCTFNPASVTDIRRTLITLFNDINDKKINTAIESFFSWDRIIDQHIACYYKVINNGID